MPEERINPKDILVGLFYIGQEMGHDWIGRYKLEEKLADLYERHPILERSHMRFHPVHKSSSLFSQAIYELKGSRVIVEDHTGQLGPGAWTAKDYFDRISKDDLNPEHIKEIENLAKEVFG